jgi:uncharacterized protein YjdB
MVTHMRELLGGFWWAPIFGARRQRDRRPARRAFAGVPGTAEPLERRALLANIVPSAVISAKPDGRNFDYTITLTNSSQSTEVIGTFWYAWNSDPVDPDNGPISDFLATPPISVTPPPGWTEQVSTNGPGDGSGIIFTALRPKEDIQPGSSLTFKFTSADNPASVTGNSVFHPGTPVGTSWVWPHAAFNAPGQQFVVQPARPQPTLVSIALTPHNPHVAKGLTEQLTAIATYSDHSTKDVTAQVAWTSTRPTIAKVSASGVATALTQGTAAISANLDGVTTSTMLTVTPAVLRSINLTPLNATLAKGKMEQFIATGTFSDHTVKHLVGPLIWTSSKPGIATITASGLARAVAKGTSVITARMGSIAASTNLTVTVR